MVWVVELNGERPSVVKVRDSDLFLCRVMYQGCHLFSQSCLFGETLKENNIKCHVAYIHTGHLGELRKRLLSSIYCETDRCQCCGIAVVKAEWHNTVYNNNALRWCPPLSS